MVIHIRYLTHPEVEIDPATPVKLWGLSEIGRTRTETLAKTGWFSGTTQIITSAETKAIETAEMIGKELNVPLEVREAMHENDRSATGFLPQDEFERVAYRFFAEPHVSVRGWERAIDAQSRIIREVEHVMARDRCGDILFVGHGAVGTLLFCHYSNIPIDRCFDQPAGGGGHRTFSAIVGEQAVRVGQHAEFQRRISGRANDRGRRHDTEARCAKSSQEYATFHLHLPVLIFLAAFIVAHVRASRMMGQRRTLPILQPLAFFRVAIDPSVIVRPYIGHHAAGCVNLPTM
jgi:broad specificity phosphatase PhoE